MFASPNINVHILRPKFDADVIAELYALIDSQQTSTLALKDPFRFIVCADPSKADVIITNIRMIKRLERNLDLKIAVTNSHRPALETLQVDRLLPATKAHRYASVASRLHPATSSSTLR